MRIFDNTEENSHQISFLVHSDSVNHLSESEKHKLNWFLQFRNQNFLTIKITPTAQPTLIQYFEKKGFLIPKYSVTDGKLLIESKRESPRYHSRHFIKINPPPLQLVSGSSCITNYDKYYLSSGSFDFFIVAEKEINSEIRRDLDLTGIHNAFEYLRLFLLKNGDLHASPKMILDWFLYYLYRHARTFPTFQKTWSIAVYSKERNFLSSLQSIHNRLTFVLRAIDIIDYTLLSTPTINSKSDLNYHFGYLNILLTGLLDDFAWIFVEQYSLSDSFRSRREISLRVKGSKEKSCFSKKIRVRNEFLADFIECEPTKDTINLVYSIRDKIQHQKYLEMHQSESYEIDITEIESKDFNLQTFIDKKLISEITESTNHEYFLVPSQYTLFIKNQYFEIVRFLISQIELAPYIGKIDKEIMKKIEEDYDSFLNTPWELYKLFEVPTLLEFEHV